METVLLGGSRARQPAPRSRRTDAARAARDRGTRFRARSRQAAAGRSAGILDALGALQTEGAAGAGMAQAAISLPPEVLGN